MADPFQPKFVDLVRNYSTTVGTGNFVLGPAVNGYAGFAAALQPGDSFYYSAIGVDKPVEREVGRGTLLADGTISRTPVTGAKTNFTTGTKSIALIAASEWFAQVASAVGSLSTFGKSLTSAAAAADVRSLLSLGAASLLDSDADATLAANSDAKLPTQKAVKAYIDGKQPAGALMLTNNLADVADPAIARANLGVANPVSVKWFGAKGDSNATASTGTDDTDAIQAAINYLDTIGGGTLYFPEGYYKVTSYLTLCKNLHIVGASRKSSYIVSNVATGSASTPDINLRNDSVLYGYWDTGSSVNVHVTIEHMGFIGVNPSNVGAALYDNNGTNWQFRNCYVTGFKYGVVLDYSELADISECDFRLQKSGGAGVWLVNGPTLTATHLLAVTNRISISRCQLNQGATAYGILDDGGYTHSYIDNNYNGCLMHIRMAGVQAYQIIGGEFEASASEMVRLDYQRLDGGGVGGCCGAVIGGMYSGAQACFNVLSASGPMSWVGTMFLRQGGAVPVTGANNAGGGGLNFIGCYTNSTTGEIVDGYNSMLFNTRAPLTVTTNSNLATFNLSLFYANKLLRCTNAASNAATIQNDASVLLPFGAYFMLQQTTAAGTASFVAGAGVTITGPTATTGQYQRLKATKIAANSWQTELTVANPLTQAITPASVAATGAVTSSGGGMGYVAGAGGAVTQATSKATGVTLNKLCGQITLNAAALAASTTVTFALTNSQIAAGDLLLLNHVSGGTAGAYALNAQCGAGTASINVRNVSAASLSEAIVIGFAVQKAVTS